MFAEFQSSFVVIWSYLFEFFIKLGHNPGLKWARKTRNKIRNGTRSSSASTKPRQLQSLYGYVNQGTDMSQVGVCLPKMEQYHIYAAKTKVLLKISQHWFWWHISYANRWFLFPVTLAIWRMTLKNLRAPLLSHIKLCASFHSNWSYSREPVKLRFELCDFELCPWPVAWTLLLSMVITPEYFMMIRWQEHCQKGVTNR